MNFDRTSRIALGIAAFVVLVLSILVAVPTNAQVAGATLSGIVKDESGASVPNAKVSIKHTATGVVREVTTNSDGLYSAPNLNPGEYEIKVAAKGFSTLVQKGIILTVGAQQSLDLTLKVGQLSQTVEVTEAAPAVELTSSTISANVDSNTMRELPLNGRDWASLATLQPGVIGIHTQFATSGTVNKGNRGFGDQLATSGHRPNENNYRINGISVNDYTNGAPGSVIGLQLGVDGIQEFSVLSTNYSAEYGRTSGGVINAIMKTGTNAFHGDAYWFLRDEGLDAKNFFDPKTLDIPRFHRNQFGGSAGGPIFKDKTFFFADYEAIHQGLGLTFNKLVPSLNARNGLLCSMPQGNNCSTTQLQPGPGTNANGVNLVSAKYFGFWPNPTGAPVGNGDFAPFASSGLQQYAENYVTSRVDHKISDKDSLDGVYFYDRSPQTTPDYYLDQTSETFSQRSMFGLEETHVFSPSLVNAARFGYSRVIGKVLAPVSALKPIAGDKTLGIVAGLTAPILNISGLPLMQGSLGSGSRFRHIQNSIQFYDDASHTRGTHTIKFGFAFERIQFNEQASPRPTGTFVFGSLQAFLLNQPTNFIALDPNFSKEMGTRMSVFGLYVQDDWRVFSNLTLNLGVRYEPTTLPSEAHNGFGVVKNFFTDVVTPVSHLWSHNQTLRNFAPRVGFSWDPFKNGKSAVRGGFGVFDVLPLPWIYTIQAAQAFPFAFQTKNTTPLPPGSFPSPPGIAALFAMAPNPTSALSYHADQVPHRNYAMNWNLNVQREITSSFSAMVGYVGSHTVHMPYTTDDSNMVVTSLTRGVGYLWPCGPTIVTVGGISHCATGGGIVANPNVGALRPTFWDDTATYESLQAQVTKRMGHGIRAQGSYTWGKCIDNGSGGHIGDPYKNSLSSLIFFNRQSTHGPCDFQITHNFIGNYVWDIPGPKSASGVLSAFAGGWELGGILTATTGSPFTLLIGGDPLGQNSTDPADYPSRVPGCNPIMGNYRSTLQYLNLSCFALPAAPASFAAQCSPFGLRAPGTNGPGDPGSAGIAGTCANLFGNAGRNQIYGPGLLNFDFSIIKNNHIRRISESFNVQMRVEFFNIFDRANFQSPFDNSTLFNQDGSPAGGAGTLSSTENPSRQIQLGMKIIW